MAEWIKICQIKEIKDSEPYEYDHSESKIMLTKIDNDIFATDRICTHAYADLSTGFLNEKERTITCPLHMSSFSLKDGVPLNLPAEEPIKTYKTKIEDGSIYVLID
jgi:3-phenylpropionate/trans-cinnamate dioxygenase ferredoxin subunit